MSDQSAIASAVPASFHPAPSRPRIALPAGACDAHCHVFGPQSRFPFAAGRTFTPADAPKERLFALHALLGVERCVVVQSSCHGLDNRVTEDALAARPGTYCGVALLRPDVTDAELARLDRAGFRGVRFNFMRHLGATTPIADAVAFSARLAPLGWHLQVHCESALIAELAPWLRRAAVPVVVDHMGRVDAARGVDAREFRALLALVEDPRIWVKVSGSERASARGAPYDDAIPFARALVAACGDRVLWGTDWPHPNLAGAVPDDGVLADLVVEIAPSTPARHALMVANPRRLYRFPADAR